MTKIPWEKTIWVVANDMVNAKKLEERFKKKMSHTSPWVVPPTQWAQKGPQSDIKVLWRHWWNKTSGFSVGEGLERLERLPPTETMSHEGKAIRNE
jgi:hypothetical protein